MGYSLEVTEGDTLEFDMEIFQDGGPYKLAQGDRLWFKIDRKGSQNDVEVVQTSSHFKIQQVTVPPGVYKFAGGIQFSNGDRHTVFKQDGCRITVLPQIGGCDLCKRP